MPCKKARTRAALPRKGLSGTSWQRFRGLGEEPMNLQKPHHPGGQKVELAPDDAPHLLGPAYRVVDIVSIQPKEHF